MEERMKKEENAGELWMVLAIIQPFKLDAVTLALESLPHFGGMTVSDCRGFGHGKVDEDVGGIHTERNDVVDFTPKIKLEIAVAGRAHAEAVIEAIVQAAHTGNPGDGKVVAWLLDRAVRVRTFDEGAVAL